MVAVGTVVGLRKLPVETALPRGGDGSPSVPPCSLPVPDNVVFVLCCLDI